MSAGNREYLGRLRRAIAEIEAEEKPPASPEEAFRRFFKLMNGMRPLVARSVENRNRSDEEPDELGFYRRWRELESRRQRNH